MKKNGSFGIRTRDLASQVHCSIILATAKTVEQAIQLRPFIPRACLDLGSQVINNDNDVK